VADVGLLVFRIVAVLDAYLLASRGDHRASATALAQGAPPGWSCS
jgi:hypothetical protein